MPKPDFAHKQTDKELAALEKRIAAEYKKAVKELQDKVDAYFNRFKQRDAAEFKKMQSGEITKEQYIQWRLAQIGRGMHFVGLRDAYAERMTKANEIATVYINKKIPFIYLLNRNYTAYEIERVYGDAGFALVDEKTVERLLVKQPDLMPYYPPMRAINRGINLAWGKRQITAQVTSGILQGESIKQIADRLQTNIPRMNRNSAIRAARTAVTGAQNAGRQDSFEAAAKMGIKVRKRWIAAKDNRTRHEHGMADGQIVDYDKPFNVGGEDLMFPGDTSGSGWNIYNCRCSMRTVEKEGIEAEPRMMRVYDPETGRSVLIKEMTYSEWKRWKGAQSGD